MDSPMITFLDVPFRYPATVIPKRCRKERDAFFVTSENIAIPELRPDEAPVVIDAELEYSYVVRNGPGDFNSSWHHQLVPVQYRRHGSKLLRPFDANFQCGYRISPTFTVKRDEAAELFANLLTVMIGTYEFEVLHVVEPMRLDVYSESTFSGKILSHNREERATNLRNWIADNGLVFIDDTLWKSTELPVWDIGYEQLKPELHPTATKGLRKYLRAVAYEQVETYSRDGTFLDLNLAHSNFGHETSEDAAYYKAARKSFKVASKRGFINIVGELPFGRNELAQSIFDYLSLIAERPRQTRDANFGGFHDLFAEADTIRKHTETDPSPLVDKLRKFNEYYSRLPEAKYLNFIEQCLEDIERFTKLQNNEPLETETFVPFSHRAKKAGGFDTLPVQALVRINHNESPVLIDREDARKAIETTPVNVKTYDEVFRVDGLPAYRATGSITLIETPQTYPSDYTLAETLKNKQLDLLAKCDWETWGRGGGVVLRPDGTGGMVARIWFKKKYQTAMYIFLDDRYTYEAIEFVDSLGEAKSLCEAAIEAYGFGEEYFYLKFGDVFWLSKDRLQPDQQFAPNDEDSMVIDWT